MKTKALKAAFPHTIPVLAGYLFMGMSFGILITSKGFSFWYPMLMGVFLYSGSMQFIGTALLVAKFDPLNVFLLTLMINARHLFYGISLLFKYRGIGKKVNYMIFGLTDETFSVVCAAKAPEGVDKGYFMFFISLLDHLYWIAGCTLGGVVGSFLKFNTKGLDFVMTAIFAVIFIDQWLESKIHTPALIGLFSSVLCFIIFGDNFIIFAMLLIAVSFTIFRKKLDTGGEKS